MVVIEHCLGQSVPKLISTRHGVSLADSVEVLVSLFGFVAEQAESLVIGDGLQVIAIVEGKNMQFSVLYSRACLGKQCLRLCKIG